MEDSPETKERLKRLWQISKIAASAYELSTNSRVKQILLEAME